jgi:hypothetical protein
VYHSLLPYTYQIYVRHFLENRKKTLYIYIKSHSTPFIENNRVPSMMSVTIVPMLFPSISTIETTTDNIPITANLQQFEKCAIRRLVRKLDRRIIPFMCLLEVGSYLNRVSIGRYFSFQSSISDNVVLGHAELMGINTDLNLSISESNWAISLFYLAYVRKLCY